MLRVASLLILLVLAAPARAQEGVVFTFTLPRETTTSAGVYLPGDRLIRTLWSLKKLPAGRQSASWDGLDDLGRDVPPGPYEVRVASGGALYTCAGVIGNNGLGKPMQAATRDLVVDRATGEIYSANSWEEAGQDFKKIGPDGRHLMDAEFRVRNGVGGAPNGVPIGIAQDGGFLYVSVFCNDKVAGKGLYGGSIIRKFTAAKGEPVKFPEGDGYIRIYTADPAYAADPWSRQTIYSLAVSGNTLLASDKLGNRVLKLDKETGKPLGEIAVKEPYCIAVDDAGRLWVAHAKNRVSVFDLDGKLLGEPAHRAGDVACLRLDGDRLWLADQDAGQIQVYRIDSPGKLALERTIGRKARPGEFDPLGFYAITSFDVMPDGGFVLAQSPRRGSVLGRYSRDGKLLWQQVGLEFCTNGTYDAREPDLFISSSLHAYRLPGRAGGEWRYLGNVGASEELKGSQSSGTPRIVSIGGRRFYYSLSGSLVKVYRFEGRKLVPAAMVGLSAQGWDAKVLGELPEEERRAPLRFIWVDSDGDGQVQPKEISRESGPEARIATFSCEVDARGDLFFPNHHNNAVFELPLQGLDRRGNPRYDWSRAREVIPADETARALRPMKVVPAPEGFYVLQMADQSVYPPLQVETGYGKPWQVCWMGGWVLSRYDRAGRRLWTAALPKHCTGLDWVPDVRHTRTQGLVAGWYAAKELYHYSPDGLLLGILSPEHVTGWLDHNGSISINRNPADGRVDVFAEESFHNRISWYRMDDRGVRTLAVAVRKESVLGRRYSGEEAFDEALGAGRAKLKGRDFAGAAADLGRALEMAAPREQIVVHELLAQALGAIPERAEEAIAHYLAVGDAAELEPLRRAEALWRAGGLYQRLKRPDEAVAAFAHIVDLPAMRDRRWQPAALLEMAKIRLSQERPDEALVLCRRVKAWYAKGPSQDPDMLFGAAMVATDTLQRQNKLEEAAAEYEAFLRVEGAREDLCAMAGQRLGDLYARTDPARALPHYLMVIGKYPHVRGGSVELSRVGAGMCCEKLGQVEQARKHYQTVADDPAAPESLRKTCREKLARLGK